MILVFGGAYQGKAEYALKHLGAGSVCDVAKEGAPDFTKDMITGLEGFVLRSVEQSSTTSPRASFRSTGRCALPERPTAG